VSVDYAVHVLQVDRSEFRPDFSAEGGSIRVIARVLDVSVGTVHAAIAEESAKAEADAS